jgi:hypothetical protein
MLTRLLRPAPTTTTERGQVLVIFAFAFVAIIFMLALLFDGARGLVMRRELRNASDAAAMAGANILQSIVPTGCSLDAVPDPVTGELGDPQTAVVLAVRASVAANLPGYDPADIIITCGAGNTVVQVQLADQSPTFFSQFFGRGPLDVGARSAAINGQNASNQYSVILLDDSNLSWPTQNGRDGCPSFLLSGGPTVIFDSSIYIDSDCTAANDGALGTNGNATTLQLGSLGPRIRIVGEYNPQALTITPAPVEHSAYKADPLQYLDLPAPSSGWPPGYVAKLPPGSFDTPTKYTSASSLKVRSNNTLTLGSGNSSQTQVLHPGVYKGGIVLNNNSVALLEPGIYVIQGGGIQLKAQSTMLAVDYGVSSFPAVWTNSCHDGSCGVMIYNTGTQTGAASGKLGSIDIGAGTTFKVRSYDSGANSPSSILNNVAGNGCCAGTHYSNPAYDHMVIWQPRSPVATSNYEQPQIAFRAGATVDVSGTLYAPQAKVLMGGGPSGSGGAVTLTLQFIVWDLELSGNSTFHFIYDGGEFVTPPDYGLIL